MASGNLYRRWPEREGFDLLRTKTTEVRPHSAIYRRDCGQCPYGAAEKPGSERRRAGRHRSHATTANKQNRSALAYAIATLNAGKSLKIVRSNELKGTTADRF